jgi:hypothetical protein
MMDQVKAKANYSRVCQLLVGKGGDAFRGVLHSKHSHSTLAAELNANKKKLLKIRYSVFKPSQWDLLFPVSGTPDLKNFDLTLLTILLRNICGLPSPATGWNNMPPPSDTSESANIARIKIFRNEVYGHIPSPKLDDTNFETLWKEISKPLINLGISQQEIDELKEAPLSPEEESYIDKLKEWRELEDDILSKLNDVRREMTKLQETVKNENSSQVEQLAKFDFTGKIEGLCTKFHSGTRQWFFDKLSRWFRDQKSRVMILTAGPGAGKSVLSAKICKLYKQRSQLAAYHFCDFRNSDYVNPNRILQSLASQMCDNIDGFRDKLTEILRREHSRDSQSDAFRVLLNDPLYAIETPMPRSCMMPWRRAQRKPKLIIVDALDESETNAKSDFLDLISEKFPQLPTYIKIFITSRPELQIRKKFRHLNPVEILPDDPHHNLDLKHFIRRSLPVLSKRNVKLFISKCEGSFLYAYYLVNELKEMDLGIEPNLSDYVPKGISGFYEKQFGRLKTGLQRFNPDTSSSILKSFVNVIATSRAPLPIKILVECMDVSSEGFEIREAVIGVMSEVLPVYEGFLTVYHKSLWDWLILDGYEEHAFVADVADGKERLWRACKSIYSDITSLGSVSDFQMSSEKRYALEHGENLLLDVGDTEDFHWLVNVRVNYLKCKVLYNLTVDVAHVLRICKSNLSDPIFWAIIQLHAFMRNLPVSSDGRIRDSYTYLQSLANGDYDVLQMNNDYKNEARNILDKSKKPWLEKVIHECNSKLKVISHAVFNIHKLFSGHLKFTALSRDNKLLACAGRRTEVFTLPWLTILFQLELSNGRGSPEFLIFSPDSSYLLFDSVRTCISIRDQKEVPFIPHGPADIDYCSFSSCGMRLVTLEKDFIKLWDVRTKVLLVEVKNVIKAKYCYFSKCNSYILTADWMPFSPDKSTLFDSKTLASLKAGEICGDTCLTYQENYQMISPSREQNFGTNIRIDHAHFPTTEPFLVANRYCSNSFKRKNRKCVIFSKSSRSVSPLVVYDFINKEIIDVFHINCFPTKSRIIHISHFDENNFLICLNYGHIFLLSFETSTESPRASFVNNADVQCRALSPDNWYIACCYENSALTVRSVNTGETLQTVVLKQPPEACWWSELYLWVVCKGVVVKYPYDSTQRKVLGNELEECTINFDVVLKFENDFLVIRYDEKISILKCCKEKLCPQQISDLHSFLDSATISSDGCAVLLYGECNSNYQLWEIACENRWELHSAGKFDSCRYLHCVSLTGTKNSRISSLWFRFHQYGGYSTNSHLYSINFSNSTHRTTLKVPFNSMGIVSVVYGDSKYLIIHNNLGWIHFVQVSDGKITTSLFLDHSPRSFASSNPHLSPFYIASRSLLLLAGKTDINIYKIHNIENYSPEY